MKLNDQPKGDIIIYKTAKGPEFEVHFEKETVWLSQKQVAELFGKSVPTINEHIKNIYEEGELNKKPTIRKFRIVQTEGKRQIKREVDLYNLDMILSVGYRVSSKRATQFRVWATKILKDHLIKGYTINKKKLLAFKDKFFELQNAISFLQEKSKHKLLAGQEQEIIRLLSNYSKTLKLLNDYDKNSLSAQKGEKGKFMLTYSEAKHVIAAIKKDLMKKEETSDLFGQEYEGSFKGTLGNISQTIGGKEAYPSIKEKAANFLYFTVKDHPFVDGNKRIASFLFVYFLDRNQYLYRESGEKKINDNALTVLALLIAASDPKDKDIIIKLITNLI